MSKVAISGNASGTGVFTIASPNSNTDRTLNLPDNTGTVLTSASSIAASQLGSQFSVSASAPSGSFVVDASGRVTVPAQPGFIASGTGGWVTISAGSAAPFNAISSSGFNDGSHFNTSTFAFTAPVSGKYVFFAGLYCGNATSSASFYWLRNGAFINFGGGDALVFADTAETEDYALSSQIVIKLSAGDSVQVASRNTQSSRVYMPHSVFGGYLIG